jgi:hypothetical protein
MNSPQAAETPFYDRVAVSVRFQSAFGRPWVTLQIVGRPSTSISRFLSVDKSLHRHLSSSGTMGQDGPESKPPKIADATRSWRRRSCTPIRSWTFLRMWRKAFLGYAISHMKGCLQVQYNLARNSIAWFCTIWTAPLKFSPNATLLTATKLVRLFFRVVGQWDSRLFTNRLTWVHRNISLLWNTST